ncbi:MAG TPA: Na+/H+ antiporter NhaA [Lentimicrobium sp.]|nr:Na+/H+ antiporter NhaA [Lentimicrobium sp.]
MSRPLFEQYIRDPMKRFVGNSSMSGIVLITAAVIAIIISNSPFSSWFHHIWEIEMGVSFGSFNLSKTLHHWINDGLMAVFFFVVGLELKREIIAGELSSPRKAILPLAAAIGGMIFPALIYLAFNHPLSMTGHGWGIPMATDIAFALGILYLLGDRVPASLKIFLTALAIADDLGAVLVIAFFYTSSINFVSLFTGAGFLAVLIIGNRIGIRSTLFYGIMGIGGLWLAFLMSGVHATIAAVLAAFAIPGRVSVPEIQFNQRMNLLMGHFRNAKPNENSTLTAEQHEILHKMEELTLEASTPLQRLEHSMHPMVAFIIIPLFALSNAGVTLSTDILNNLGNQITLGVAMGLFVGKFVGVSGMVGLLYVFKISVLPEGCNWKHIVGVAFLSGIGFTMSLFIAQLAFDDKTMIEQAKVGIFISSLIAGIIGYLTIKLADRKK